VEIPQRKGDPLLFTKDEEPFNVKFEKIPELKPAFQRNGTVTAANASTLNDGAAALVLMSREKSRSVGIEAAGKDPFLCRRGTGARMVYHDSQPSPSRRP